MGADYQPLSAPIEVDYQPQWGLVISPNGGLPGADSAPMGGPHWGCISPRRPPGADSAPTGASQGLIQPQWEAPIGAVSAPACMCENDDNTKWPAAIEDFYVELIYEESKTGMQTSILDKKTWMKIANEIALKFGKHFTSDQLKAKWNRLRRSRREFKALIETTGLGWDSEANTVTAEKEGSMNAHTAVNVLNAAKRAATQPEVDEEGTGDSDEVWGLEDNRNRRSHGPTTRSKKKGKNNTAVDAAIEALAKSATLRSETSVQKVDLFQQYLANRQARTMALAMAQKEDPTTSIETCMDLLNGYGEYLDDNAYTKAAHQLAVDISLRRMFVKMPACRHLSWIRGM
ncbi:hypothetical protein L484_000777 [Morus notabilis]|uniref:Myb/SANT-like domain-containing protein n=1 Tax=Morus notabilis TaxID=981085 RepID=W9RQ99_9ROSA|nr:hypothetical protein L484_000777 [Morus notabilis]